jgi:K+-dependent Na+/Ca+ exchanger-like protein
MAILSSLLILLLAFYLLALICDGYFVPALDKIAHRLKMSHDMAGATLMAIGSSAPELFIAIIALIKPGNHVELGMGTIIGSALFNILVIIGLSAIVRKAVLHWQPVIRDMLFYTFSILLLLFVFKDGQIELSEALLFLGLYILYVFAVMNWRRVLPYPDDEMIEEVQGHFKKTGLWKQITIPLDELLKFLFPQNNKYYKVFLFSIALIGLLSWLIVEEAIKVAEILQIPEAIIALTVLAVGTSIPDLISSVIVSRQGRGGMAISNAVGSNIFDILFGLGMPWAVLLVISKEPIPVSTENLWTSVILLFATVLVIFFLMLVKKWKISKHAGYFLVALYIAYLVWAISQI